MENQVLDVIKRRRSIRKFKQQQIEDKHLDVILEAGQLAPYAQAESLHFSVIQSSEILERINAYAKRSAVELKIEGLSDLGQEETFNCLYNAPTCIVVSSKNEGLDTKIDAGAAVENMILAAESLSLGSCWLFYPVLAFVEDVNKNLKHELKIPEGYTPITSVVIGYKDEEIKPRTSKKQMISYIK